MYNLFRMEKVKYHFQEISFYIRKFIISIMTYLYMYSSNKKYLQIKYGLYIIFIVGTSFSSIMFSSMKPMEPGFIMEHEVLSFIEKEKEEEEIFEQIEITSERSNFDPIETYRGSIPKEWIYIIISIESEWEINAYNKKSGATGLCQITPIALEDFNIYNTTNKHYTMNQIKDDPVKNIEVGCWLLNRYKNIMISKNNWTSNEKEDFQRLYTAFNVGIGNFYNYYWSHYKHGLDPFTGQYRTLNRFIRYRDAFYANPITVSWKRD